MAKTKSGGKVDVNRFREKWHDTGILSESMVYAGYSPESAKCGYARLNKRCKAIVDGKEVRPLSEEEIEALIKKLQTPQDVAEYVRGKIVRAVERGESPKSLEAHLKLLGNLRDHNIFDASKAVETFVVAPLKSSFDELEEWDLSCMLADNGGQLLLKPVPNKAGLLSDPIGNLYRVRVESTVPQEPANMPTTRAIRAN